MNRTVKIIIAIVVMLAVAGGSFYGGTLYGKNQAQASFVTARGRGGAFPGGMGGVVIGGAPAGAQQQTDQFVGGALFGQIKEIGDDAMVIHDANGKPVQIKVTDTTLIEKQASVTLSDLAVGETVIVSGSRGEDGSITARSVQVAPAGRFGMTRPAGGVPVATLAP